MTLLGLGFALDWSFAPVLVASMGPSESPLALPLFRVLFVVEALERTPGKEGGGPEREARLLRGAGDLMLADDAGRLLITRCALPEPSMELRDGVRDGTWAPEEARTGEISDE